MARRKGLTKKLLNQFRQILEEKRENLLRGAQETIESMANDKEFYPDPADRATMESDRNFSLRLRDRDRKLFIKVTEALERIEDGSYGICEECGDLISEKRLMARPVTTLCIDCKTRQEEDEKRAEA